MNKLLSILFFLMLSIGISAQSDTYNQMTADGNISQRGGGLSGRNNNDYTKNKTITKGIRVWTVDERFGDTTPVFEANTTQRATWARHASIAYSSTAH